MLKKHRLILASINAIICYIAIIIIYILIGILVSIFYKNDIFWFYSEELVTFLNYCIGWIIALISGYLIFVTLLLQQIGSLEYKNISVLKYALECKGDNNTPWYMLNTKMSLREDIFFIFILTIFVFIFQYFLLCILVILSLIIQVFLLFAIIYSSLENIKIETNNFLFTNSFDNYINEQTSRDLNRTKSKKNGDRIDIDIDLLYKLFTYISKNKYSSIDDYTRDTQCFANNIDYIILKNKWEFFASYYNINYYLQTVDFQLELIKSRDVTESICIRCNKIKDALVEASDGFQERFYAEKYALEIMYISELVEKLKL